MAGLFYLHLVDGVSEVGQPDLADVHSAGDVEWQMVGHPDAVCQVTQAGVVLAQLGADRVLGHWRGDGSAPPPLFRRLQKRPDPQPCSLSVQPLVQQSPGWP